MSLLTEYNGIKVGDTVVQRQYGGQVTGVLTSIKKYRDGDVYYRLDGANAGALDVPTLISRPPEVVVDDRSDNLDDRINALQQELDKLLAEKAAKVPEGWELMSSLHLVDGEHDVYDPVDPSLPWMNSVVREVIDGPTVLVVARRKKDSEHG